MRIRCPRCRATYEPAPGAPTTCPSCHQDASSAATLPDVATGPVPGVPSGPPPAAADPLLGREIGGYRIRARLGRGGMSTVYQAEQVSLGRTVALKIPHEDLVRDDRFRARFALEARTLARLAHPGIVQVYDVGSDQGLWFIAMEFVEGTTLGRFLARNGSIGPATAVPILRQCLAALARAHAEKIVHRDIKPDNILLMRGGKAKLTDFGLAKSLETASTLSLTGTILGTPLYMSPEQADGNPVDARSDLYSLGATFYHALTGRPPFEGATPVAIVLKHVKEPLRPAHEANPAVPLGLSNILSRMLAKRPEDRYASADAVLADLDALRRGTIPAAPPTTAARNLPPWKRKQILAGAGTMAAMLLAAFAIGALASRDTPEPKQVPSPAPPAPGSGVTGHRPDAPPSGARDEKPRLPPRPAPDENGDHLLTLEDVEEAMAAGPPPPAEAAHRRFEFRGAPGPIDGRRPRPERMEAVLNSLRNLPREPEPGTRESLRMAREALADNEPMMATAILRASRRQHAAYIDSHPDVKAEYDKLTQEAVSKIPPGMRRQIEETPGRFGRGRGGPLTPP